MTRCLFLVLALFSACAAAVTVTSNFSPSPTSVDNAVTVLNPSLTLTDAHFGCSDGFTLTDINIQVSFDKTDGTCGAPGDTFSFHDEIALSVVSSGGISEALVNADTYSGNDDITPGVTVTFDQAASTVVSGTPTSGTFRPVGNLDDFNESVPSGSITYTMTATDDAEHDPLCMFFWSVTAEATCIDLSVTGPTCSGVSPTATGADEGAFNDLTSTAPAGYRVNIHSFIFRCDDTATVTSEYYFKSGPSAGFEEIRWPWVLHFQESFACAAGKQHLYEPLPLVIGEKTVGYLTAVDNTDDVQLESGTSPFGDAFLTITPGRILGVGSPFSSGSSFDVEFKADVCFIYSLDQFGGLARTRHGFEVRGFDGASARLPAPADGVYSVLAHSSLRLSARLVSSGRGAPTIAEAGLRLADGHSLRLEADGIDGPLLEVELPTGEVQMLLLDGAMASRLDALDLRFADDADVPIRTQVFASSFGSRAACLQDPMLARYYELGDLDELNNAYASARVTLTSEAFEVTLVVLGGEEAATSAGGPSIKVLCHRRLHLSGTERGAGEMLAREDEERGGLLGVTAEADWHLTLAAEEHLVAADGVLPARL